MLVQASPAARVHSGPVPSMLEQLERALEVAYQSNDVVELAVATWKWQKVGSGLTEEEQTRFARAGRYLYTAQARTNPADRVRLAIAIALSDGEVDVAVELVELATRGNVLPTGPNERMTSRSSGAIEVG